MNMITKNNKLLILICIFAAFSMLASCSFLFNDTLVEHPDNNVEESNIVSGARQIELKITPCFDVESKANYSRSAFPEFSETQLAGFTYTVTSEVLSEEVTGNCDSGKINFSINVEPFSNKTFTFYVKNSDNQIICTAQKSLSCSAVGTTINESANFSAYTGNGTDTPANGTVSLAVEHTGTGYSFYNAKVYKNPGTASEAEETAITCTNSGTSCLINSTIGGVAPGTYEFRAYVKNPDGIPFMFFKQKIEVWPGIATNKWYLSNGTKDQTYEISGTGDNILYVRGTGGSLYGSGNLPGALAASDDNAGTLLSPLASLQKAINLCTNSAEYHIYIDGNVTGKTQINSGFKPTKLTIEGTSGNNETDILDGNKSDRVLWIANTSYHGEIILKNIKITNGLVQNSSNKDGGGIQINNGCTCKLENVWIDGNEAKGFGGGINNVGNCFIYGSTIIGSKTATTFAGSGEGQYSNIANYGGAVHNSGNLYIGYSGIGDTSQPVSDPSFSGGIYYNYARNSGGAIYNDGGSIYFIKGNISYNTAAYYGGGVYSVKKNLNNAYLYLYGGLISNNKASISGGISNGGAVYGTSSSWVYFKASSYIPLDTDKYNTIFLESGGKIYVEETLNPPAAANGIVAYLGTSAAADAVIITAVSGVDLAAESQKFKMMGFPKIISSTGTLTYASDFYVSSAASTPAGSDTTGDGSEENPFATVTKAVALIKNTNISADYKIHISGTIVETASIKLKTGSGTDCTLGEFENATLTLCGTDNTTDKLDGNENHNVLSVSGTLNLTITNLTIQKGNSENGGGLNITSGANVVLEEGVLITENTAEKKGGGVYIYDSKTKLTMETGSIITKNYISATDNGFNEYGGGGVYIDANTYSDANSPELILNGGEISEHSLAHEMRGAGVFVNKAKLIVNSGKITKNKVTDIAANVMLQNNSKMTMTGGEISYGEINGTGDASAAGVWINGTTSMTMSGGKICNNTVKAASGHVGRGAGVTVWQSYSTFTMTGGEISENKVDTSNSNIIQGGAVCVYNTTTCNFSGDINIPYGVNGIEGKGLNDVWIYNNNKITITGKLSTPDSGKIGAISLQSYTEGKTVLTIADDASPATTIEDECGKFTLVQPESGSEKWLLLKSGKLRKEVQTDYVTANAVSETTLTSQLTMNGVSGTESSLFIAGRTISIPKMIVSDHELTQKEYLEYCYYAHTAAYKKPGLSTWTVDDVTYSAPVGDNYPATYVSWYDAIVYCNLRSIDEGLTPAYSLGGKTNPADWEETVKGTGTYAGKYCGPLNFTATWNSINFDTSANGWRMPTELEWEYLARGGTLDATDEILVDSTNYNTYAWVKENTPTHVCHEVKQKTPNKLGLYDIFGNVYEYVWDWSGEVDQTTALTGRTSSTDNKRMVRGGGMKYEYARANPFNRTVSNDPEMRWENCGVRIVRNAD